MKLLTLTTVFAAILSSCAFAEESTKLEPLYSAQFDDTYITIEVQSTGCTKAEDFTILASGKGGEHFSTLGIRRDQPDFCKAMPQIISLQLELPPALAALKEPYRLDNLFVSRNSLPGLVAPPPENR